MTNRIGIVPEWVEDLLGVWAAADVGAIRHSLSHPTASPMFRLWGAVDEDTDTDGSYSGAEVLAMRAAVERLQREMPAHYDAVVATFKPWRGQEATAATRAMAVAAGSILAVWVDEAVDGC